MVEMEMTDDQILDVVHLQPDLGELGGNRIVLGHLEAEALGERSPPAIGVGDRLVVVAAIEHHIPFGMLDHVEADRRPVDIAGAADLQRRLGEPAERARSEDVELGPFLGRGRQCARAEQGGHAGQGTQRTREPVFHGRSSDIRYAANGPARRWLRQARAHA
jgi:hypothetical protein